MHVGTGTHNDPSGRINDNSGAAAKLNSRDHKDWEDLQIRVLLSSEQHISMHNWLTTT
jgi:hypothetical protein